MWRWLGGLWGTRDAPEGYSVTAPGRWRGLEPENIFIPLGEEFSVIQDHETCDVIAANVSHRRNAASLSKVGALNYIAAAYILGASAVSNNKIPRGGSDYITISPGLLPSLPRKLLPSWVSSYQSNLPCLKGLYSMPAHCWQRIGKDAKIEMTCCYWQGTSYQACPLTPATWEIGKSHQGQLLVGHLMDVT